ncbi:MAG TPA: sialidase family protein [Candidatus Latescibacteria bacterium]|nr:sialidase family protein [Candidatus Latescibacterota bacterium]HQK22574.1 sialidase family protein [Candidatus Latescibacterota bacterium]HRS96187.1 sialidase family protein [Candidatus Latescibacterota bacterium]
MSELHHTDVFVSGQDGFAFYRIPVIEVAADGSILAFVEARKHNLGDPGQDKNHIALAMKRSTDGGRTWSPMVIIEDPGEGWSAANPATVFDRDTGRVWLHYLRSKPGRGSEHARPGTDDLQNLVRTSDDNGVSWSEPTDITTVCRDMADPKWRCTVVGPGGGIQDSKGRLMVACWMTEPMRVFAVFSDDHGHTWQRGGFVPGGILGNEDQLVELADGRILLDFRQAEGDHRWFAESTDGGRTWSQPRVGEPVSPVACAIERFTLKSAGDDKNRIIWSGPKGPGRENLVVRISEDEAASFPNELLVATGKAAYVDAARLKDGSIGLLWEREHYQFITFTTLDLAFLTSTG